LGLLAAMPGVPAVSPCGLIATSVVAAACAMAAREAFRLAGQACANVLPLGAPLDKAVRVRQQIGGGGERDALPGAQACYGANRGLLTAEWGTVTASLTPAKLEQLPAAEQPDSLRELGRLERTLLTPIWLTGRTFRQ